MSQKAKQNGSITAVMSCTTVKSVSKATTSSPCPSPRKRTLQETAEDGGTTPKAMKQQGTDKQGASDKKRRDSGNLKEDIGSGAALEMLECPVCLDYPRSRPIYTCDKGHIVCPTCREGLKAEMCPTCRDHNLKLHWTWSCLFKTHATHQ